MAGGEGEPPSGGAPEPVSPASPTASPAAQAGERLRHREEIGTKFKYLGMTDEVTTCDNCGKPELRGTAILASVDDDGNEEGVTYYGSSCASSAIARQTGQRVSPAKVLENARQADRETRRKGELARRHLRALKLDEDGQGHTTKGQRTYAVMTFRQMPEGRWYDDRDDSERQLDAFIAEQVEAVHAARLLEGGGSAGKGDERGPDAVPDPPEPDAPADDPAPAAPAPESAYEARQRAARERSAARERETPRGTVDPDEEALAEAHRASTDHQGTIRSRNAARAEIERLTPIVEARRAANRPDPVQAVVDSPSAYERRTMLRNLDDAQIGQLMTKVALDRDHPNRRSLMTAINKENERRADARASELAARRAREQTERERIAATPERKAAALATRLRDAPDITPGANSAGTFYAAGLQQAARDGRPRYYSTDRARGRYQITDAPPDPAIAPAGYLRIEPDGTAAAHLPDGTVSGKTMGLVAHATKAADRADAMRAADAVEPAPRVVFGTSAIMRTQGLTAALNAPDLGAEHVDTQGLRDGMRADAHAALDAIARVHRVDDMPRIQTITEASSDSNGAFVHGFATQGRAERALRERGMDPAAATDEAIISMNPNAAERAAFTFAHEYGHALDKFGLVRENRDSMGTYAVDPDDGDEYSKAVLRRMDAEGHVPEAGPLREFVRAAAGSPTILEGSRYRDQATTNNGEESYLAYRNRPDEMWARAYSQFIAVRSGDARLLAGLRDQQAVDAKPDKLPMQWPDDEFEREIAPAVEAVLRARGWMD